MKFCPKCKKSYPNAQRFCLDDGEQLSLQDPFHLIGRTLADKYRLDSLIGIGGMGAVYGALHTGIDRRVAVKIVLPHLAVGNEKVLTLFEREAKMAGRLSHENIVDVKDAGQTSDGIAYMVMEWLEGKTLEDEISTRDPLSFERASMILRQVAAALEEAHTAHVVHRDLKPSNVMLIRRSGGREQVKVLDFGIGKVITDTAGSPVSAMMGTPHYASPEQFQVGSRIDARSDIYSLGVMIYQMLTGALPFNATSIHELIQMHVSAPPPALRTIRPDAPPALDQLVSRMMAKDPAERPQRVSEIPELFDRAVSATAQAPAPGVEAREMDAPPKPKAFVQRDPPKTPPAPAPPETRPTQPTQAAASEGAEPMGRLPERPLFTSITEPPARRWQSPLSVIIGGVVLLGLGGGYGLYQYAFSDQESAEQAAQRATAEKAPAGGEAGPLPGKAESPPAPAPSRQSNQPATPTAKPTTSPIAAVTARPVQSPTPAAQETRPRPSPSPGSSGRGTQGSTPQAVRIGGGVLQGNAIRRVQPPYPAIAKAAKASGAVQVAVTISEDGQVISASAISGHPLLRDAAVQAARQWVFKPTELSGVPVKVQGILTFNFTLQ